MDFRIGARVLVVKEIADQPAGTGRVNVLGKTGTVVDPKSPPYNPKLTVAVCLDGDSLDYRRFMPDELSHC